MDRRLKQFLAVAETGNVSVAADLLHVTQPTVSVNLHKLEEEHGVKLFDRSSRGMTLTDFGDIGCVSSLLNQYSLLSVAMIIHYAALDGNKRLFGCVGVLNFI